MGILVSATLLCLFLTVYVYIGYPLILILLKRIYAQPILLGDDLPMVTMIIAAYNEAEVIDHKIENSFELDYPQEKLEILVVADGSTDATAEIVKKYADRGVQLLFDPERGGKSAALNRGVDAARGEIIVFSDANAFYLPESIRMLVRNFADPSVGCVSGMKTVRTTGSDVAASEGIYWKYETFIKKAETRTGSTVGVVGEMNAIRRNLYEPIPRHIINDDSFLAWRILGKGYRVLYEPKAISWELASQSIQDEVIRRQRINAGRYQQMFMPGIWISCPPMALFKLFSHKFFRLLLPFFMIGALGFNALLLFADRIHWFLIVTFLGQAAIYTFALIGFFGSIMGQKWKIPTALYYIVSSNLASLRGFFSYISGKQTNKWIKVKRSRIDPA